MGSHIISYEVLMVCLKMESDLNKMAKVLKCGIFEVANTVEKKLKRIRVLEKDVK